MNPRTFLCALAAFAWLAGAALAQIKPDTWVHITIAGVPEDDQNQINGHYPVSPAGTITMPYLGSIHAAGLTLGALARNIEAAYHAADIYQTPTVLVSGAIGDRLPFPRIIVAGFVRKPGPVELVKDMTIWQALHAAGGENEFGSIQHVILRRAGKQRSLDLRQAEFKEIKLEANDSIEVPQKEAIGN